VPPAVRDASDEAVSSSIPNRPTLAIGRQIRIALISTITVAGFLGVALFYLGPSDLWSRVRQVPISLGLAVLGLSLTNYFLRCIRWHVLCNAIHIDIPFIRNSLYYVSGFAFSVSPGKIGEVSRLWLLRREQGAGYERTFGLLVLDRVTDAVPLLALCLLGASRFGDHAWSVAAMAAFVIAGSAVVLRPGWLTIAAKAAYGRIRRRPRLFARLLSVDRALLLLVSPRVLGLALVLGLLGWSAEVFGAWLVLRSLGVGVDPFATAFVFGFGMLVGGLPMFPGGVGGAEGTMVGLLVLLKVELTTAIAATALIRLATLGFALALGFLALPAALHLALSGGRKNRKSRLDSQLLGAKP
jgi:glycosyltransferase 2 family protein